MDNFLIDFGNRIKWKRKELGLTLNEVAKRAGYSSRSTIVYVERGEVDVPQSKIISLAKALETTPAYLMGWEEKENNDIKTEVAQILNSLAENDQKRILAFARGIQAARQEIDDTKYSIS